MATQIEAERQFLVLQEFARVPAARLDHCRFVVRCPFHFAKQAHLGGIAARPVRSFHRRAHRGEKTCAMIVQVIEGTGAHQRLDSASVDQTLVHASTEIEQVSKWAVPRPRFDDTRDGRFTSAFDGSKTIADCLATDRPETESRFVDVWWQSGQTQ